MNTKLLFSAHAEVIPTLFDSRDLEETLLRACGGNSHNATKGVKDMASSPRMRR